MILEISAIEIKRVCNEMCLNNFGTAIGQSRITRSLDGALKYSTYLFYKRSYFRNYFSKDLLKVIYLTSHFHFEIYPMTWNPEAFSNSVQDSAPKIYLKMMIGEMCWISFYGYVYY